MTTAWVEVAMVIFMVVFILIVLWVLLTRRDGFRAESRIPLEEDRIMTPRDTGAPRADRPDQPETTDE